MRFLPFFIGVLVAAALVVSAFLLHSARPARETDQPTAALVRATGKCAQCHRRETGAIVHEFEMSVHAREGVTCLDCHQPIKNEDGGYAQEVLAHRGFEITAEMTALNCQQCHNDIYRQFLRSRHAAPAWAAVRGRDDFTPQQIAFGEKYHHGQVDRDPNALALLEGEAAIAKGCAACHDIGKPNADGSIGTCTACHARHVASIELARLPTTCGQCHMGPDHSQMEIFNESKHGVLFAAQRDQMNLSVPPAELTTEDMPVPTCATCHMSGLNRLESTHDTTGRLSYFLYADVSDKRDHYTQAQVAMKQVCSQCHTAEHTDEFYAEAEDVVVSVNERMRKGRALMAELRAEGLLTPEPFDEEIEYVYFDLWHYYGRTAKHGAFMGGADFVQWHGNYEILHHLTQLEKMAAELRDDAAEHGGGRHATTRPAGGGY